jgi:hypothetical protein
MLMRTAQANSVDGPRFLAWQKVHNEPSTNAIESALVYSIAGKKLK